ncbi:MAG TPA: hypothetical protein DCL54_10775 [Alphaproteobacteria bacterium]|nr:hypothetical protein [Alphaproteobacteria bacterium]HAJ47052.1 hypothetical protein [Alphaproteobacteria bacterium]
MDNPVTDNALSNLQKDIASRSGGDLRREDFTPERIDAYRAFMAAQGHTVSFLSPEEREASRQAFLTDHVPGEDLWLFGYGSLMWNPAVETLGAERASIDGFSRAFALTLAFGRGTPDRPGLMLVLLEGQGCTGLAHRIPADKVDSETQVLWLREMLSGAYRPVWQEMRFADRRSQRGLVFVANAGHPRVEANLPFETIAQRVALAEGALGTNRDYLYKCEAIMAEHNIADPMITQLARRVREICAGEP